MIGSGGGDLLAGTSVMLCVGAGGVGKTTIAAALAREAAKRGRRAVVVTIDPARRLADALGISLSGDPDQPVQVPVEGPGEMWALMLDAAAMFDAVVRERAADAAQAERILSNRFYRSIARSLGGTQEYMASEMLHRLHGDARWDLVVVDTPPSRASLRFLGAPDVLGRFLEHRAFRAMMLAGGAGGRALGVASRTLLGVISSVVGGGAVADAVSFFQAFSGMETGFRVRAREVREILVAGTTACVVVTTAQQGAVDEAIWLRDRLISTGHHPRAVVVNRVHPHWAATADEDSDLDPSVDEVLARNLAWVQQVAASEAAQIARLRSGLDSAGGVQDLVIAQVPLVAVGASLREVESLEGTDVIGEHLGAQLMTTGD